VPRKVILRNVLGKDVSKLKLGADEKDLDETFSDVLSKMMVIDVDVLGSRAHIGKTGQFKSS